MKHPNESGEVGYDEAPLWLTLRIHIKAKLLRFIANVDARWWMLRNRR